MVIATLKVRGIKDHCEVGPLAETDRVHYRIKFSRYKISRFGRE